MHVKVVFYDQSERRLLRMSLCRLASAAKVGFPPDVPIVHVRFGLTPATEWHCHSQSKAKTACRTAARQLRAQPVNLDFSLRALAAQKLRRERKTRCRLAAGEAAIRADRGIDQTPNLHRADEADHGGGAFNGVDPPTAGMAFLRVGHETAIFRMCNLNGFHH